MATDPQRDVSGDCSEDVDDVETEQAKLEMTNKLNLPHIFAAMQGRSLPKSVRRRIKGLKKLQLEHANIEAEFFKEVHALECKYNKIITPLHEKRFQIVSGAYEPTDEECDFSSDEEDIIVKKLSQTVKLDGDNKEETPKIEDENVAGIPDFWLTIFKNVSLLAEMVQPHDEPILKHLIDIKVIFVEQPMGFKLEFYFEPNGYFSNTILTKEYDMMCAPEADDPFSFEGPEIYRCRGCTINWKEGKNVTMKTLRKKQKHKSRGIIRTVTKTVANDSFFNFFSPPTMPEDVNTEDVDEDLRTLLTTDYEIGHYIRERIVPRAVLYYTGEGIEEEEDYEEEEEDEDDDDEDDDSDKEKIGRAHV